MNIKTRLFREPVIVMNVRMMFSKYKDMILVIALTLLTFGNVVRHGFVGDDEIKIVKNGFYQSLSDLPLLWSSDYIAQSNDYYSDKTRFFSSGEVSYRPIVSLSYFVDYQLWKLQPWGYHLTSLLLHVANGLLVLLLFQRLFPQGKIALVAALLFSVHPLRAEAVAAISYRHDLLACFFTLGAMLCYIKFSDSKKFFWFLGSLGSYGVALFAKESALGLPLMIVGYDVLLKNKNWQQVLRSFLPTYLPYILITVFYLWVYIFIFPNSAVAANPLMGGSLSTHIAIIFKIFFNYLQGLCWPFGVSVVPPLYTPPLHSLFEYEVMAGFAALMILLGALVYFYRQNKTIFLLLSWFAVFYIPISNMIPLANPLAHRFLYLPSIGFAGLMAVVLIKVSCFFAEKFKSTFAAKGLIVGYVAGCMMMAMMLSYSWKSNVMLASGWVKEYPWDSKGYSILGIEYYRHGDCGKAKIYFLKDLELGSRDHRSYYYAGVCSSDASEAEYYYQRALEWNPDFTPARSARDQILKNF